MAEIELNLSKNLCIVSIEGNGTSLLGITGPGCSLLDCLKDEEDKIDFQREANALLSSSDNKHESFTTLTLVFKAPGAPTEAPKADRSPLSVPHASPLREGFHCGSPVDIACFTKLERLPDKDNNQAVLKLMATEYSRNHRKQLVHQQFEALTPPQNISLVAYCAKT